MFRLLSKESNIFSVPVYIGFLLLIVIAFNIFTFSALDVISAVVIFAGIALGYFCFNAIALNYRSHLPLFLYTFFIFALYPGSTDIGISWALLTNSFLLLVLTSVNEDFRKTAYVLVGAILALNFIFLPATWPMIFFVILHITATSQRIGLNIFRLFFGAGIVAAAYFSLMFFLNLRSFNPAYFPFTDFGMMKNFYPLLLLSPVAILLVVAVGNHFQHFNEKSPVSKYKYTFLLVFSLAQLATVVLYMGKNYEYLILLALPASIILARYLWFIPKPWMREACLWLIIFTLIIFKAGQYFNFQNLF